MVKKKKRYEQLKRKISETGYVLKGTITERYFDQGEKRYGPYYQWTFKEGRKTITVNLSKEQKVEYGKAIRNYKRVRNILREMEKISLQILESTTVGVKKRIKRRS